MAQLKDLIVQGPSRFVGNAYASQQFSVYGYIYRHGFKKDGITPYAYIGTTVYKHACGANVAATWYYSSDITKYTTESYFCITQYSPNTTANTSTASGYEIYRLPSVAAGLTTNNNYYILTTKSPSTETNNRIGSTIQPVYVDQYGVVKTTTYTLNANITTGVQNRMAYYSGTNTINYANNYIYGASSLEISNTSGNTDIGYRMQGSTHRLGFQIGSGNENRGVYEWTSGIDKWLLVWDSETYCMLNTKVGIGGKNTSYQFYVSGSSSFSSTMAVGGVISANSTADISGANSNGKTGSIVVAGGLHTSKGIKIGDWTNTSTSPGVGIRVHDLRDATITGSVFGDSAVNWYFKQINGNWAASMHIKGWNSTSYYAWEIAGNAGNSSVDRYYVRTNPPSSAGTWHTLTYLPAFAQVGGSNNPVYVTEDGVITSCSHPTSGAWFNALPRIGSDGVMEVGKYIDFHNANDATTDNDYRLTIPEAGYIQFSGRIVLTKASSNTSTAAYGTSANRPSSPRTGTIYFQIS